ncbi:hypothetical protein HYW32_01580 [Candidatus Berkelbacteria bacterium]|nr:hypothetical protein [Candidatus Berkelbacteria bacterium]
MKIQWLIVALIAYITVLAQTGPLAAWPLMGGQPNLIALGALPFLVLGYAELGLGWILIGSALIDLILPLRFGSTFLPLLLVYSSLGIFLKREIQTPPWWGVILMALVLVATAELVLAWRQNAWEQFWLDLRAAGILSFLGAWPLLRFQSKHQHKLIFRP